MNLSLLSNIENILLSHPNVAECVVIEVVDLLKGQLPLAMVVLKVDVADSDKTVVNELAQLVRDKIDASIEFKTIAVVKRLPKSRTGKIFHSTLKKLAEGKPYTIPSTIEEPEILDELKEALQNSDYQVNSIT